MENSKLTIYRKCEKSLDNLYGIEEIKTIEDYDRPFLMCISPQDKLDKSVFGIIKEGAQAARVRTTEEYAGGYKIDEIPFDFLGLRYEYKDIKDKKHTALLKEFIYPFLKKGNDIKEQAKKINFFTYCNGTSLYVQLEKELKTMLYNDGYSNSDIEEIISNISLVSIASDIDLTNISATSVSFKDVNDTEVKDRLSNDLSNQMIDLNRNTIIHRINDNSVMFAYNGTGEHNLKEYLSNESMIKPSLCSCVSTLVNSSINNDSKSIRDLINIMMLYNGEFDRNNTMLDVLDEMIDYKTPKYTKEEGLLVNKLDRAYKKLAATKKFLEIQTNELQKANNKKQILINGIQEKCSDVAFSQIVCANGLWNPSEKDLENYNKKTDKEIREEYELEKTSMQLK